MRPYEQQLDHIMEVLTTAVRILPTEQSRDGALARLDQIEDAADCCEQALRRLDIEQQVLGRGSRLLLI